MRAMMMLMFLAVCASCSSGSAAVIPKNPVTLQSGCEIPAGQRALRARLDIERGQGNLTVDGQASGRCGVYALTPGQHEVTIHAEAPAGFGLAATLQAFSDGNGYDVFDLHCGSPGSCDTGTLRTWRAAIETDRRTMTDPCAALKVTNVKWESQQLDDVHPRSLDVSLVLHVYAKPSGMPPHDPTCPEK